MDAPGTARWPTDFADRCDPRDPNRLFVAVAGHPYGPNAERGIYRSTDGGQNFEKVLYKDENTGGAMSKSTPVTPIVVYATLWEAREAPWENGDLSGTGGGIYKSTDGGQTWKQLAGGLPAGIIQAYIAIRSEQSDAALRRCGYQGCGRRSTARRMLAPLDDCH